MSNNNLLPTMVSMSKNYEITEKLYKTLTEKLSEDEINVLDNWLNLLKIEKEIEIKKINRNNWRGYKFI